MMNKSKLLKSFMSIVFLILATLSMMNAHATDGIRADNGVAAGACTTCHTTGVFDKAAGRAGLTTFCAGRGYNSNTFVCNPATPTPVVCTLPAVRDAATNTCKTPACPTGQVRNAAGVCVAPTPTPVVCTPPAVRDAATNTCKTPACPTGQVRNAAGVCVVTTPTPVVCTPPAVRDAATNTCSTPACPTGQVRNAAGVCVVTTPPPPSTCTPPKQVVKGVCTLPTPPAVTSVTGSLGKAKSGEASTDVYAVTCATKTTALAVSVKDLAPVLAPMISIQATQGTASSALSTDSVDGDANYSPATSLAKGAGVYLVKVNKSAAQIACGKEGHDSEGKDKDDDEKDGKDHDDDGDDDSEHKCYVSGTETYTANFSCQNAAGATKWVQKQNQ
jgi:hypothetical protein